MKEIYEYATSDDGIVFSPYKPFISGDVVYLAPYVRFRLTAYGNIEKEDYKFRSIGAIMSDATLRQGGFGISPFGKFPFGDGGICEPERDIGGSIQLTGNLGIDIIPNIFMSGSATFTGTLSSSVTMPTSASFILLGGFSLVPGTRYISLGGNTALLTTFDAAKAEFNFDFVLKGLFIKTQSTFSGSGTVQFVVNGTPRSEIVVSLIPGNYSHITYGTLNINTGDQVAIVINTTATPIITNIAILYEAS